MDGAGPGDGSCRKDTVLIALTWGHQAVGGIEDGGRETVEFLLLVLPCRAEVALQVGIGLQFWIGVGGEHLSVGVNIYPLALGLLEKGLQVGEVMAGHHDEGTLLHFHGNGSGGGGAIGIGVGLVKDLHAFEVHRADLHDERQQPVHVGVVLAHGAQGFIKEGCNLGDVIPQHPGMISVGCHAPDAEQDEGFETADILLLGPQGEGAFLAATIGPAFWGEDGSRGLDLFCEVFDGFAIEIYVCQGGEKRLQNQAIGFFGGRLALGGITQADERLGEGIL
ncbi:hypothetical protein SDC9_80483 [bioreactor metagenome]|uniref:Uncharacterized protein n=1 Tax=bioreactor metagenome TaxID=1076179 RepID=A0A644YZK3_9ZZZZ